MTRARIQRKRIITAIENSGGLIARVAKTAGYTWGAVRDFIQADPELSKLMQEEAERVNDAAENTIISKIMEGDDAAARWWLARTRRAKFGDNVDVTSGGGALEIVVKYADGKRNDTDPTQ